MKEVVHLTPAEATVKALEFYNVNNANSDKEAEYLLRSVLMVDLSDFDAHNILGALCARRKNFYEAFYRFSRALAIAPDNSQAKSNLGMVLCHFGHFDDAIGLFKKSLELEPDVPAVLSNLATLLQRQGMDEQALEIFERVMALDPGKNITYFNRGICHLRLGRLDEALANLDEAVRLEPTDADAHYNRGIARLSSGDFAGGWADYEYRTNATDGPYYIGPFQQPKWDGSQDLNGKTILVHAEQGMGDSIQFLRYIPMLKAMGARVIIVMHNPLHAMAKSVGAEVLLHGSKLPAFDYWIPLVSMAWAFGTVEETIPPPAKFGFSNSEFQEEVSRQAGSNLRVGVCWSGNWQHKNDAHRSIDLSEFRRLFYIDGVSFFNLQKDVRPIDQAEFSSVKNLIDLTPGISDMADTAGLIENLDLVVTCDTSVAHLAGSLGMKTFTMIPAYNVDWRWMRHRDDTPWYPAMKLYRQEKPGAWSDVLHRVADDIRQIVKDRQLRERISA